MGLRILIVTGAMLIALLPRNAAADWLFMLYFGGLFGGTRTSATSLTATTRSSSA